MHRGLSYALSLSVLGLSLTVAAHATPISAGTYNLANTTIVDGSNNTYTFTGTVTLNSSGLLTAANITLNDANLTYPNPVFNSVTGAGGPAGYNPVADYGYVTSTSGGQLYLSYLTTLDGSGNIDLCILGAHDCNSYQASNSQLYFQSAFGYSPVDLTGGAFDPSAAATPEPSSLVLLTTGIFGVAGVVRRRVTQA